MAQTTDRAAQRRATHNGQLRAHRHADVRGRRALAATAAAAVMLLALSMLAGCGSGGTKSDAGGVVKITLSMQNPNIQQQDPATYDIVQAFNAKNANMQVVLQGQTVEQHEQQMTIAAQSHTLPDMFWVYNALAQTMQKNNNLLDLTPILAAEGLGSKFATNMLSGFKQNGVQYGLPYQSLVTGFYYNKAVLAKYNLSLPTTFDELMQVVTTLHAHGVTTIAQGANNSSYSVWAFLTMLDRFGYEQKYPAILAKTASYDNADFLRLYQHIQALAKAGAFPSNMTTQTYAQSVQSFISGQSAMLDSGVWDAAKIQQSSIGNNVGFWAGPTFSDGVGSQQLVMNAPSAPLVVSAAVKSDSAKYNVIKAFIGFYYSDAGQQIMVKDAQTPVTTYQPTGAAASTPVFASVLKAISQPGWTSPQAQPDLVVSAETANAMYESIYGVMEGVSSPSKALSTVQDTLK